MGVPSGWSEWRLQMTQERMRNSGTAEAVARKRAHECVRVPEHIHGSIAVDSLRRIEVRAC